MKTNIYVTAFNSPKGISHDATFLFAFTNGSLTYSKYKDQLTKIITLFFFPLKKTFYLVHLYVLKAPFHNPNMTMTEILRWKRALKFCFCKNKSVWTGSSCSEQRELSQATRDAYQLYMRRISSKNTSATKHSVASEPVNERDSLQRNWRSWRI